MKSSIAALLAAATLWGSSASAQDFDPNYLATYSIIARDPVTGELGMGVQSKAFAAGNRAVHGKGGLVIIAHQASANPMYGAIGVELLEAGYSPQEALDIMVASDEDRDRRQVAILDAEGRSAAWTGTGPGDYKGHHCGVDYCAQGNSIAGPQVVEALSRSFEGSAGHLAERLMDALDAAEAAGGDRRGKQSGAILVVSPRVRDGFSDRVVDIRVDDHREPLLELRRVLDLHFSGEIIGTANQLRAEGDLAGALAAAVEARDRSPENDNAWVALATVQLEMGSEDQMLESLRRAVELNPGRRVTLATDTNFEDVRDGTAFRALIGG